MIRPYRGKRVVDLAVLAALTGPSLFVGLATAAAIKLTSRGPVFFRQERVGLNGERFHVLKFRTMVDRPDNPIYPDPDRITRVGRWLRRLSIDELPQLINVARGEMSIVGPRPALPYQVARYDKRQRDRLAILPGITGLAQVRGRNQLEWAARIELDLHYLREQSIGLDLRIIGMTVRTVLAGVDVIGHPTEDALARIEE